jgi:hypothetical protein
LDRVTLKGKNHAIHNRSVNIFSGTTPETVEIRNLTLSNGNLGVSTIYATPTNRVIIANSTINNGIINCTSNVSPSFFTIENVTVSSVTLGSDLIQLGDTATSLTINNTQIVNGNLNSSPQSGHAHGLQNLTIRNLTLTNGNVNISNPNDTISHISITNSDITGSFNLFNVNPVYNNTETAFIHVTNLTITGGQMYFADMFAVAINVTNSTVTNGLLNITSNVSADVSILHSNFSNTAAGSDLIVLGGWGDVRVSNNNLTNGSLRINQAGAELRVTGNTISNTSHVLIIDTGFGAFDIRNIYNNKFVVDSGNNYIENLNTGSHFNLSIAPASGSGLTGGPYVAGNYWATSTGNGYSDMLAPNNRGYSTAPYDVPTTDTGGSGPFIDSYPLSNITQSQGGSQGSSNQPPVNNNTPPNNDPPETPETPETPKTPPDDSNLTNTNQTGGRSSISDTFKKLKEEGATTGEVISGYIIPASVVMAALVSALLLLIVSLIDLFFDITSEQVRKMAKERTKYKLKFNPPTWSDIFKPQTAYLILLFIIGVALIDTLLDAITEAAIDNGLLAFLVAIIPPFIIVATVNIGGGLFLDEAVSYYLRKIGKFVRRNTSIFDVIEQQKHINVIAFCAILFLAAGIVTFMILLFGWTLI